MGCGKSTVGRALATQAGLAFVDMDQYIVEQAGLPVEAIFARYGEPHFRSLEAQACKTLSQQGGQVIATGGGALTFAENAKALRQNGIIILLDVSLPLLQTRLERDPTPRPVLQQAKREGSLEALHASRMALYRKAADLTVSIRQERPAEEIASDILYEINGLFEK